MCSNRHNRVQGGTGIGEGRLVPWINVFLPLGFAAVRHRPFEFEFESSLPSHSARDSCRMLVYVVYMQSHEIQ